MGVDGSWLKQLSVVNRLKLVELKARGGGTGDSMPGLGSITKVPTCDEPRVQSTLKGFTKVYQRLQRLGEARGFTTSTCSTSVSIAKDVQ